MDNKRSVMDENCSTAEYNKNDLDDRCEHCSKKSSACISLFAHENAMMHKDTDNERAHRTTLFVCITFLLIVVIFVAAYTVRTAIWLETVSKQNAAIVEIANAKGVATP